MSKNWQVESIGKLFTIRPPKKEALDVLNKNEHVSFVPMANLNEQTKELTLSLSRQLSDVYSGYTFFAENDVLLAKITPCFENGKLGIARNLVNGIGFGSSEFFVFRTNGQIIPEYLFYFLSNEQFRTDGKKQMIGAVGHKRVPKDFIENYKLPFPPSLPEQKRIVKILDKAFAAIDKAKTNAEKNLQNSRELFDSYLNNVFAPSASSGQRKPGKDWEEKKLNQMSENLDSRRIPITKSKRIKGKYPYYGASGIVDYVNDYIFDEDLLLVSEDGANLLARTYPIAFSISGKTWVNNHAHVLRFENMVSQRFVQYYLNAIKLDDYVSGMAQPKLNQNMLNSIVVPFPKIDIQKFIVKKADALSIETKILESIYHQKLNDLEELKKSILQKAFDGQL
ncbi:MAG: restriction endonuclease subunit S [Candidatus Scalindua sp.]